MIILMAVLTFAQVYIELKICSPRGNLLQRTMHKWNRKSPMFGLALSLVISIVCSAFFGAAGMLVFASGIVSTVITQIWYSLPEGLYDGIINKKQAMVDKYMLRKDLYFRRARQTWSGICFVWKCCMLPFMLIGKCLDFIDRMQSKFAK